MILVGDESFIYTRQDQRHGKVNAIQLGKRRGRYKEYQSKKDFFHKEEIINCYKCDLDVFDILGIGNRVQK